MRAKEFLIENQSGAADLDDLEALANAAKDMDQTDPLYVQIIDVLRNVAARAKQMLAGSQQQISLKEEVAVADPLSILNNIESTIQQILAQRSTRKSKADANLQQQLVSAVQASIVNPLAKQIKSLEAAVKKAEIQSAKQFKKGAKLGAKKGQEAGATQVLQKQEEEAAMLKNHAVAVISRFADAQANDASYVESFINIFKQAKIPVEEIINFLRAAVTGKVIKLDQAVKVDAGTIFDYVDDQYQNVFKKVYRKLFGLSTAAQRGSVGPGEIMMVILGSPVKKAEKGDLDIAGVKFEVKASKSTKVKGKGTKYSGGRLTSDTMPVMAPLQPAIAKLLKDNFKAKPNEIFGTTKKGGTAVKWSATRDGLKTLNMFAMRMKNPREAMINFTKEYIKLLMPEFNKNTKELNKLVNRMVNKDGTVDDTFDGKWMQGFVAANYIEYAGTGHFDAVMFLNADTLNYIIVRDPATIQKLVASGDLQVTNGVTSNDPQNKGAVQIFNR